MTNAEIMSLWQGQPYSYNSEAHVLAFAQIIAEKEREACAEICEEKVAGYWITTSENKAYCASARDCAIAIRMRAMTTPEG